MNVNHGALCVAEAAQATDTQEEMANYEEQWRERMVPGGGIEPPTLRFSVACSTN